MKRRDFLKVLAGGGLLLATESEAVLRPPKSLPPQALGILYDSTICIGCKACVSACKQYNNMPPEHTSSLSLWDDPVDLSGKTLNIIKVYKTGTGQEKNNPTNGFAYIKRHCMHCIDPACVSACPASALRKDPQNGVVRYNKDACIGCRYCQVACPFNIPKFQWEEAFPQIKKCQLCDHRYAEGNYAACCQYCPSGASIFGRVSDLMAEAKKRLSLKEGTMYEYPVGRVDSKDRLLQPVPGYINRIYGEKEAGGTQYLMLSKVDFNLLGMPELPHTSYAAVSEGIQHTVYKGFIAPVAVFAGLLAIVYRNKRKHEGD